MQVQFLIITIISFILSLAGTLILAIATRKKFPEWPQKPALIHALILIVFVLATVLPIELLRQPVTLLFFCSGLLLSAWVLRSRCNLIFKIYFGSFLLLFPAFLYSPSTVFYFVSGNTNLIREAYAIDLKNNYYLIEQRAMLETNGAPLRYKFIQKKGPYKLTLARDLAIPAGTDSVRLSWATGDSAILHIYTMNPQTKQIDSTELHTHAGIKSHVPERKNSSGH